MVGINLPAGSDVVTWTADNEFIQTGVRAKAQFRNAQRIQTYVKRNFFSDIPLVTSWWVREQSQKCLCLLLLYFCKSKFPYMVFNRRVGGSNLYEVRHRYFEILKIFVTFPNSFSWASFPPLSQLTIVISSISIISGFVCYSSDPQENVAGIDFG